MVRPWDPQGASRGHYPVFGSSPGHPGKPTKAPQVLRNAMGWCSTDTRYGPFKCYAMGWGSGGVGMSAFQEKAITKVYSSMLLVL